MSFELRNITSLKLHKDVDIFYVTKKNFQFGKLFSCVCGLFPHFGSLVLPFFASFLSLCKPQLLVS
jgi:hypothetical protein